VFDATTSKFRDITFQKVNFDEDKDLCSKYDVHSIPRLVMLDASGKAIYNATPPRTEEGLAQLIGQHR
jgi:thioredoxin-related protein